MLRCPGSLSSLSPPEASQWVFLRPAALFAHPRLGRIVAQTFDDAAEDALFTRARVTGVDVRLLERALWAETAGQTLWLGAGALDGRRIAELMWERLLPPRRRDDLGPSALRFEGSLAGRAVGLAIQGQCGLAAWAEGAPRSVDAVLPTALHDDERAPDPEVLLRWRVRGLPRETAETGSDALQWRVQWFTLDAQVEARGVALTLRLEGPLPDDTAARLTRAVARFAESTLGGAIGADVWASGAQAPSVEGPVGEGRARALVARVTVPWSGLEALGDVLRGRVAPQGRP
ncbi:MAG: hypothetical protein JNK72_06305 [Myxococcales bacterium]|nr:hypothetical protein [Myxococcales bacterium]